MFRFTKTEKNPLLCHYACKCFGLLSARSFTVLRIGSSTSNQIYTLHTQIYMQIDRDRPDGSIDNDADDHLMPQHFVVSCKRFGLLCWKSMCSTLHYVSRTDSSHRQHTEKAGLVLRSQTHFRTPTIFAVYALAMDDDDDERTWTILTARRKTRSSSACEPLSSQLIDALVHHQSTGAGGTRVHIVYNACTT